MSIKRNKNNKWRRYRKETDPAHKAQRTKGARLVGRITFEQYKILIKLGEDGDVIKKWTKQHASNCIEELLSKKALEN